MFAHLCHNVKCHNVTCHKDILLMSQYHDVKCHWWSKYHNVVTLKSQCHKYHNVITPMSRTLSHECQNVITIMFTNITIMFTNITIMFTNITISLHWFTMSQTSQCSDCVLAVSIEEIHPSLQTQTGSQYQMQQTKREWWMGFYTTILHCKAILGRG